MEEIGTLFCFTFTATGHTVRHQHTRTTPARTTRPEQRNYHQRDKWLRLGLHRIGHGQHRLTRIYAEIFEEGSAMRTYTNGIAKIGEKKRTDNVVSSGDLCVCVMAHLGKSASRLP
jgi:hypothetical protein